jgi:parallel beta-helix repeat protein
VRNLLPPIAAVLFAVAPLAARTPIDAPATIDAPGSYVVTRNLRSTSVPALVIQADNVVIDLGGHTLTTHDPICCVVFASVVTGLRFENGSIVGQGPSDVGFVAVTSPELNLQNVTFSELGTAVRLTSSRASTLRHNRVARGITVGFELTGSSGFLVEDNVIEATTGVLLAAASSSIARNFFGGELRTAPLVLLQSAFGNRVADNVLRSNGEGIIVHGSGNAIERNLIHASGCALSFEPSSADNLYRGNSARSVTQVCDCAVPARGAVCDEGTGNVSHGDNYLPDPM